MNTLCPSHKHAFLPIPVIVYTFQGSLGLGLENLQCQEGSINHEEYSKIVKFLWAENRYPETTTNKIQQKCYKVMGKAMVMVSRYMKNVKKNQKWIENIHTTTSTWNFLW